MLMKTNDLIATINEIGPQFAERATDHDREDTFVAENFADLKERGFFSAQVPTELGGSGVTHSQIGAALRVLAGYCPSTALSHSMHQHLVSAAVWNHRNGRPGKALLEKVAANELALISTGANDWLGSNGSAERVEGGYRVNARKVFASGSPGGDVLITSVAFDDPDEGPRVIHFPLSFSAEGVRIEDDWQVMGMRGTGSNTVVYDNVFVPEDAVVLSRPRGELHPVWHIVLTVAMPLISAVYVGIADKAAAIACRRAAKKPDDPTLPFALGEMENKRATAEVALDSLMAIADDLECQPDVNTANDILVRKTIVAKEAVEAVEKAVAAVGGAAYFRSTGLEKLMRDVQAVQFHPLPEKRQLLFTGRLAMGLAPIGDGLGK